MEQFNMHPIGTIEEGDGLYLVRLHPQFAPALEGLEGFRHVNVLWWFSHCDNTADRSRLWEPSPYRDGPERLGTFATRSPARPNPLALSCAELLYINKECAELGLAYLDAAPGTPVLDIKPYTPSLDRVAQPGTPDWCAHWPDSLEESGAFDWSTVFGGESPH